MTERDRYLVKVAERWMKVATLMGCERDLKKRDQGARPRLGPGSCLAHICGAMGEAAVATDLGLLNEWERANIGGSDRATGDVGGFEVRTPYPWQRDPHLIVNDHDVDGTLLALVLAVDPPTFEIAGWFPATEARRHPEWRRAMNGCAPAQWVPRPAIDHWLTRPF